MTLMKTLVAASSVVVVASCQTPPKAKQETRLSTATEPERVVETRFLPGKVVTNPYPLPDSALTPDPVPLTEEHISGEDIPPEDAMATAVAWSKQYHDLATTYDVLRGWIIGVRAGQNIDADPVFTETPTIVKKNPDHGQ